VPEEQLLGLLLWLPVEDTELLTVEEGAAEGLAITSFRMLLEGLLKAVKVVKPSGATTMLRGAESPGATP
jgi:hypothetical protein